MVERAESGKSGIRRNDPCWCGSHKKWKNCHYPQQQIAIPAAASFAELQNFYKRQYNILLKPPEEVAKIKEACHIAVAILDELCLAAQAGVTTLELDVLSEGLHKKYKVIPAPLGYGYPPYPKTICTSINEVICHGIPSNTKLQEGDIVNIDVSVLHNGYYGDCSRMVMVGKVTEEKERLIKTCFDALHDAVRVVGPNVPLNTIGAAITKRAHANGCSVVDQFVGHGIGREFHEPPEIMHHQNSLGIPMAVGMVFTIEPMINLGRKEAVVDEADGWTARTIDGLPSAQWEHTIAVTEGGAEILTPWRGYAQLG